MCSVLCINPMKYTCLTRCKISDNFARDPLRSYCDEDHKQIMSYVCIFKTICNIHMYIVVIENEI